MRADLVACALTLLLIVTMTAGCTDTGRAKPEQAPTTADQQPSPPPPTSEHLTAADILAHLASAGLDTELQSQMSGALTPFGTADDHLARVEGKQVSIAVFASAADALKGWERRLHPRWPRPTTWILWQNTITVVTRSDDPAGAKTVAALKEVADRVETQPPLQAETEQGSGGKVELTVREPSAPFPEDCTPEDVRDLIAAFVDAFNTGDEERLPSFFGEGFQWFSVTTDEETHVAFYTTTDLPAYFAARHRQGERWELSKLEVSAGAWHGGIDIVYDIERTAKDLPGPIRAIGKGMVRCDSQTIAVWSMGVQNAEPHEMR